MTTLSEKLREYSGKNGVHVRKIQSPGAKTYLVAFAIGANVLIRANLVDVIRIDGTIEGDSLVLFEPTLPGAGWAIASPGRSRRIYFRIPYKEGFPFVLNDNENHRLKELAIDAEKQTITVATMIEETKNDEQ